MIQVDTELLSSLYQRGVKLWVENGQLRFQAPRGELRPEELNKLRTLKAEIIDLLEQTEFATHIPLKPRAAGCQVPLTAIQSRVWNYLVEREERLTMRVFGFALRIFGSLNSSILKRSIEGVVQRHESLRTRFVAVNGLPTQHVDAAYEGGLELIDLTGEPLANVEESAACTAEELVKKKIDLSIGPLCEAKLLKLSDREHVLILALDHMITDGVSSQIINREIWSLYQQAVQGQPMSLPELPVQFADYAVWQHQTYGAWLKKHGAYWKNRLVGAPRVELPFNGGLAEVDHPISAMLKISFGETLSVRLRDLARRERTLLALVILTVYVATISRWCSQQDLLLTFVSNGRYRPELENMVGFLATQMYLRIEIVAGDSLLDLLKRVSEEFRSAYNHHDFDRAPDLVPGCTTDLHFNWLPHQWAQTSFVCQGGGDCLQMQGFPIRVDLAFRFGAWVLDAGTEIVMAVQYRTDLFEPSTIESLGRNLRSFAEELSERSFARVASISMERK